MTDEKDKPAEPEQTPLEKLKTENDLLEKEVARKEELDARAKLGGGTNAGQSPPQITEEQKKKQEAVKFFEGTQIAKSIEKYG